MRGKPVNDRVDLGKVADNRVIPGKQVDNQVTPGKRVDDPFISRKTAANQIRPGEKLEDQGKLSVTATVQEDLKTAGSEISVKKNQPMVRLLRGN